jgi:GAF domain-containing protein
MLVPEHLRAGRCRTDPRLRTRARTWNDGASGTHSFVVVPEQIPRVLIYMARSRLRPGGSLPLTCVVLWRPGMPTNMNPPEGNAEVSAELIKNTNETLNTLFSAGSVGETSTYVVQLAVTTIEGCAFAGIFLDTDRGATTPVSTDPVVIEIDALQHRSNEGPCLDAMNQGSPFYADNLGQDERWPAFGPMAAERGVRSIFAVPLNINGVAGALNLYACYPQAFGVIDRGRGALLAALARSAYLYAQTQEHAEIEAARLHQALATREIIGQAQGILMERERMSGNEAFDVLRRASQHLNIKLRDIAQDLVDTGERPKTD